MKKNTKKPVAQKVIHKVTDKKAAPQAVKTEEPEPDREGLFKKIFYGSLLAMLVLLLVAGHDTGVCYDELTQNVYAKDNINFYKSGGKDTTCFAPTFSDQDGAGVLHTAIKYYTCVFEYIGIAANTLLGNMDGYEYNTRHVINQFISVIALLFTGLMAVRLTRRYRVAVIAIWLMFLTPIYFGMSLFNSKDIPFLAGYIASLYFISIFLEQLPRPTWKVTLGLMAALFFTFGIRIGGVIIYLYIALFGILYCILYKSRTADLFKNIKSWLPKLLIATFGALILVVLSWPYVLVKPVAHLTEAITAASKFPQKIPVLFEGVLTNSLELPPGYLPKMMLITIPALVIIGFIIALVLLVGHYQKYKPILLLLLLFTSLFPIAYAELSHASMYNSWRHFLFTYPGIIIITATSMDIIWQKIRRFQIVFAVLLAAGMTSPILWIVRTTPYQYTYFNEFTGGFSKVFHEYEKDYWFISVKEAIEWLIDKEHFADSEDTVVVATNSVAYTHYYFKRRHPELKVRVVETGVKNRDHVKWDYAILGNFFLNPNLEELYYPPPLTIHTVDIDGMPVNAILKDRDRYDVAAMDALTRNEIAKSDSLFNLHLQQIGYRGAALDFGGIGGQMAYTKLAANKTAEAAQLAQHTLLFNAADYLANTVTGIVLVTQGKQAEGRKYLQIAIQVNPADQLARRYLGTAH